MPNSLTRVLSSALVFSTYPPELVWGTVVLRVKCRSQLFLEAWDQPDFTSQLNEVRFIPTPQPTCLHQNPLLAGLPSSVLALAPRKQYRNINLFPISFAFRLHLRGRLTLPGLSLDRNPWVFGERDFHPLYRYSCQHSHFHPLQHASPAHLQRRWNALLPLPCGSLRLR